MPAVIVLDFDPWLRVAGLSIRWQAIALTVVIALSLALLAWSLRRLEGGARVDDVAFVVLGILPGAVVVGRFVHGLDYVGAYGAEPLALFDLSRGSLSLVGAVLGGALAAVYVGRALHVPVGRWAAAAAIPLLLAIGLGKLAMVLGGAGQGAPFGGDWALAFGGDWAWTSTAPGIPAHPSQVYEGLWALAGILFLLAVARLARDRVRGGTWLLIALAWWLAGRFVVAFTWRDEPVVGPFGGEQLATLVALVIVVFAIPITILARYSGSSDGPDAADADTHQAMPAGV